MSSSSSKVEIEKFDGSNDFGLWKMKILAHLGILGLDLALENIFLETIDVEKRKEVLKKAYNTLILCLSDKVLYLKAKFFTWKMKEGRSLQGHIDDFNKLIVDLSNIGVKYEDEDKALVLLYSLPKSYETLVDILQHGRETISVEEVVGSLKAKE
ncbi:hypothetical protein UlMin_018890 [Ulmus minor]